MTAFPIFKKLTTSNYGLYPGTKRMPDLEVAFQPGLTLVLGANGLGKTTLVTMLFRMCTGPVELSKLSSGDLGAFKQQTKKLSAADRRLFADRVNDNAETASATLTLELGQVELTLTRSLANLELTALSCDGEEAPLTEDKFQSLITEHSRVSHFADWILILRHITFYFEERRSLVWDPSAQRQLLRLLFLPPAASKDWSDVERDVLQRDSRMRNLQNTLGKEEAALTESEDAANSDLDVRGELAALEDLQRIDQPRLDGLNDQVLAVAAAQQSARLGTLRAESDRDSAYRDLERRQLTAIAAAFPDTGDTARYLLAQMISEDECLACGSHSPRAAKELQKRIGEQRCVICNSKMSEAPKKVGGVRGIPKAIKALASAETRLAAARELRSSADIELDQLLAEISELEGSVSARRARIATLASQLPPEEAELLKERQDLSAMRVRLESQKRELKARGKDLTKLIKRIGADIVARKGDVQEAFQEYAEGFLLETASLAWRPHKDRVGESGPAIDFPNFELEMGGADFPSPVRREGPQQVSESQREFIDLAFRMALIRVAGIGGVGSIVIDAPESSLDAVFVTRAADVLTRFAADGGNRLLITSNLIEGDLIPELMRESKIKSSSSKRVVDLLKIAAPTAATRILKSNYEEVRHAIFEKATE